MFKSLLFLHLVFISSFILMWILKEIGFFSHSHSWKGHSILWQKTGGVSIGHPSSSAVQSYASHFTSLELIFLSNKVREWEWLDSNIFPSFIFQDLMLLSLWGAHQKQGRHPALIRRWTHVLFFSQLGLNQFNSLYNEWGPSVTGQISWALPMCQALTVVDGL